MEILPPQFTDESPARPAGSMDDLGMAALRGVAPVMCKPFQPAELAEAFDFTGSPTFPIETFIS
jgi:hypothetical protein